MPQPAPSFQPFAWRWVFISMALFVVLELIMGEGLAHILTGGALSDGTSMLLRNGLQLVAFFLGGAVIGVVSPKLRLIEPALGAVGCMLLILVLTWMTPVRFYGFGGAKLLAACAVSFFTALAGAITGERVTGNL